MEAAKGTAAPTAAAPPAQALMATSVRRPRLIPASSFMEKSLLGEALLKSADYTESARPGQILVANALIHFQNSADRPKHAGVTRRFAQ
jgi:hypothetical protein